MNYYYCKEKCYRYQKNNKIENDYCRRYFKKNKI